MNIRFIIFILINLSEASNKKAILKVQNVSYFIGPENFGVNMVRLKTK